MTFQEALKTVSQEFQEQVARWQKQNWLFDLVERPEPNKTNKPLVYEWTAEKMFNVADNLTMLTASNLHGLLLEIIAKEEFYTETPKTPETSEKVKPIVVYRNCRVELSDTEVQERGQQLIKALDDKDAEISDFASVKDVHKSKVKKFDNQVQQFRHAIAQKSEYRFIECFQNFNYHESKVTVCRADTGEILEERAMLESERQQTLFKSEGETE